MVSSPDEWEDCRRSLGCLASLQVAVFGIILPVLALAVETHDHLSREIFLDPIPSGVHVGLIALVPLVMGMMVFGLRGALIDFLFGMVVFTCGFYATVFAPMIPQGLLGIVFFGLGLLPLAPALACLTCLTIANRVVLSSSRMFLGFLACLLGMVACSWRLSLTRHWEVCGDVANLRRWGDTAVVSSDCLSLGDRDVSSFFSAPRPAPEKAREMYWRMTDRAFEDDAVSGRLQLTSSRWDGSVDARAGLAYLEWTAVLHNPGSGLEEGRMLLTLPPDTVPSRVTLWVNGLENVLETRRDPLLVTAAGPGRVQVRCYPVPAGGDMKFRIGFTTRLCERQLLWPRIVDDVWLESHSNLIVEAAPPQPAIYAQELDWS